MSPFTIILFIFLLGPIQNIGEYCKCHKIIISYYKISFRIFPLSKKAPECDICYMEMITYQYFFHSLLLLDVSFEIVKIKEHKLSKKLIILNTLEMIYDFFGSKTIFLN